MDELEKKLEDFKVDIVILTLPKEFAISTSERLCKTAIKGVWNFTGQELDMDDFGIVVENVHIGDSLMTLCYEIAKDIE